MSFAGKNKVWCLLFVPGSPARPSLLNKKTNMVGKPGETGTDSKRVKNDGQYHSFECIL